MPRGYDVIVVGGGTSGCVLATRLSEDPAVSVMLVEGGPDLGDGRHLPAGLTGRSDEAASDTDYLTTYAVELDTGGRRATQIRGRVLGGSSMVNGSIFTRGIAEDYDSWACPRWTFDALLPFFKRSERDLDFPDDPYHGSSGPIPVWRRQIETLSPFHREFYEAALERGAPATPDLNHPAGEGIGPVPRNDPDGVRISTFVGYLAPIRERPNLTIRSSSVVTRISFEGSRAVAIEGISADGSFVEHGAEIVLAAGAFGSPQLLLLSGVGPAAELRALGIPVIADLPVGQNLTCHPGVTVYARPLQDAMLPPDEQRIQVGYSLSAEGSAQRRELLILPRQQEGRPAVTMSIRVPDSRGELRLTSTDPTVPPRIRYGYLEATDREKLRGVVQRVVDLFEAQPLASQFVLDEPTAELCAEGWVERNLSTAQHACGTCRMGRDTDDATVVDDRCRVLGLSGLRVADLSIVPRSVSGGPHATVVMLGERVAALLHSQ